MLLILAQNAGAGPTSWQGKLLASAKFESHEHNSRQRKLSFYPTIASARGNRRDSHKMLLIFARNAGAGPASATAWLALSMAAADNKCLSMCKFGCKDEYASCQLSFYPTLASSPHVQRDSHIKLGSSWPARNHRQMKMSGVCSTRKP